jgi:hypothetical protein
MDAICSTTFVARAAGSPEHLQALAPLVRMHRATRDIIYVYTGVYRNGRIYWVLDSATQYRVPGDDAPAETIMSLYEERDAVYEAAFRDGKEYADPEPRPNADGHGYFSVAVPIRDSHGELAGMFGLDMVLDKFDARIASIRKVLYIALVVVALLSIGAGAVAHRSRAFSLRPSWPRCAGRAPRRSATPRPPSRPTVPRRASSP